MPGSHIVEEEIYTHEYLWRSSNALAEIISADEARNHRLILPALTITAMGFEAFVNFCGFILLPEQWTNERRAFRGQGIEGKLSVIAEHLPKFTLQKGKEPYQSINKLLKFRDSVAHGKVHASFYETKEEDDGSHFRWEHTWDSYLSREAVEKARRDVRSFCQPLLVAMRDKSDHPHLIHDAFEGPLASASGRGAV